MDKYLSHGISRILGMQTNDGGFSYWPGQSESSGWGSIYAGAALTVAKKNGIEVPEEPLAKALKYFNEQLKNPQTPDAATAFAAYILALNRACTGGLPGLKPNYGQVNQKGNCCCSWPPEKPSCGPWRNCRRTSNPVGPDITKETLWGWDEYNATGQGPALALMAAKAIMPEDPLTKQTALLLLGGLDRQGIWTSTSSTGWALLALGDYFQGQKFDAKPGELTISQPPCRPGPAGAR